MKRFQFTLQALRTLRERQEQLALRTYGNALQVWEQARAKVAALQQDLEAAWGEIQQRARGNCAALELDRMRAYCQSVEQRRQPLDHAAKVAQSKASQTFTKFLAARQARAVVDKFFENQKRSHDRQRRRYEQHALDDMVNHQEALLALTAMKGEALWS
jgi:flagellar export protein FliJ